MIDCDAISGNQIAALPGGAVSDFYVLSNDHSWVCCLSVIADWCFEINAFKVMNADPVLI